MADGVLRELEITVGAGSTATCFAPEHHITAIFKTPTRRGKWIDVFRSIGYKLSLFRFGVTGCGDGGCQTVFVPPGMNSG
jgi:hypothetical protein